MNYLVNPEEFAASGGTLGNLAPYDIVTFMPGVYKHPRIQLKVPNVTLRSVSYESIVILDGEGFNYAGNSSTPRAAIEIHSLASRTVIDGLSITNCTNRSNAAGIRLIGVDDVTIRHCSIDDCDNGIFASQKVGVLVDQCSIAHCGLNTQAHNIYFSGTGNAVLLDCILNSTLSGNTLKSRLSHLTVERCYISNSTSRELDLVDGPDTEDTAAYAVIKDSTIVKRDGRNETDPLLRVQNRNVCHFGKDGIEDYDNKSQLVLIGTKIFTVHQDPVFILTGSSNRITMIGGGLYNPGPVRPGELNKPQKILDIRNGEQSGRLTMIDVEMTDRFA